MRSIRLKILLIGAIATTLMLVTALFISYGFYYRGTKTELLNNIDSVLRETKYEIEDDYEYIEDITAVVEYINNNYTETEETFDDPAKAKAYYKEKYSSLYSAPAGLIGFSKLNGQYNSVLSLLKSKSIASSSTVYLAIFDFKTNKIIYVADSRDSNDTNIYYYPGSAYDFTSDASSYIDQLSSTGNYNRITINGKTSKLVELSNGKNYLCHVVIEYNMDKVVAGATEFLKNGLIFFSIGLVLLLVLYYFLAHVFLVKNVLKLKNASKEFSDNLNNDNIDIVIPNIKSKDEIGELSKSFVSLEKEIINYVDKIHEATAEKEKINAELSVATKIQLESLPNNTLNDSNVLINTFIKSAKEVGGDFYDYFYIDENHLAIIISDVSGKGIPAALFMMKSKELIKSKLLANKTIEEVCFEVNNELLENNEAGLFITAFIGVLDINSKTLELVSAGHEKPYLLSNGRVLRLDIKSNFILGGVENYKYQHDTLKLKSDDRLFLHTDGLNESIDEAETEFGYDRILNCLSENYNNTLDEILNEMDNALNKFTNNKEQFDDITMLILELKSNKLEFSFNNPGYEIISEVTNKFNDYYSYLDESIIYKASIIIDELLNNYVSYEEKDNLIIKVSFDYIDNNLIITFENNGMEFNPLLRKDKYIENDDNLTPGGLGITMVKKLSSDVKYERINDFNKLVVAFKAK